MMDCPVFKATEMRQLTRPASLDYLKHNVLLQHRSTFHFRHLKFTPFSKWNSETSTNKMADSGNRFKMQEQHKYENKAQQTFV